jgi:hypothetical protein
MGVTRRTHKDKSCGLGVRSKEAAQVLGFGDARRYRENGGAVRLLIALLCFTRLSSGSAFEDEG